MGYAPNVNLAIFPRLLLTAVERAGIWLFELAMVLVKGHAVNPRRSCLFSFFVTILMAQFSMKFTNHPLDPQHSVYTFCDVLDLYSAQRLTYT